MERFRGVQVDGVDVEPLGQREDAGVRGVDQLTAVLAGLTVEPGSGVGMHPATDPAGGFVDRRGNPGIVERERRDESGDPGPDDAMREVWPAKTGSEPTSAKAPAVAADTLRKSRRLSLRRSRASSGKPSRATSSKSAKRRWNFVQQEGSCHQTASFTQSACSTPDQLRTPVPDPDPRLGQPHLTGDGVEDYADDAFGLLPGGSPGNAAAHQVHLWRNGRAPCRTGRHDRIWVPSPGVP